MTRAVCFLARATLLATVGLLSLTVGQPLGWAAPGPGGAPAGQPVDDPAVAFTEALKLWESGDYAAALPLFRQAAGATGSPNARLYIARCLRDMGQLPAAYEEMSRTVQDAMAKAKTEKRYVATRDTAAAELALLERRVGKVVVALHKSLADAQVTLNGQLLEPARLGQPVPVDPGRISIVATGSGGNSAQRDVDVAAGAVVTVTMAVGGAPAPVVDTLPQPAPPPPEERPDDGGEGFGVLRAVGIGVAAVGVGGFVMFAVGRVMRDDEIATLEEECGAGPCTDPAFQDTIDSGRTAETISGVGLGIGIAGVLAGTALIIFGGPSSDAAAAGWSPTPNGIRVRF